jgi:signal transduction histidine kinase
MNLLGGGQKEMAQSKGVGGRLLNFTEEIGILAKAIHGIRQLHPAILDDLGPAAALRNECIAFSEQYGLTAEFNAFHIPQDLADDVSLCLYRVGQEKSEERWQACRSN